MADIPERVRLCLLRMEGAMLMNITLSELFQFCLVLIGIIDLFLQFVNKKK